MLWQDCLSQLKTTIPENDFNIWLLPLHAKEEDNQLYLFAPNTFVMQKVNADYIHLITDKIRKLSGNPDFFVKIEVGSNITIIHNESTKANEHNNSAYYEKENNNKKSSNRTIPLAKRFTNNLSVEKTFENFVEGKSNQLARAAALHVAENIGSTHNPFFIYGGVGLGKTHLMHSIGNKVLELNHKAKVIYLTSEHFVNDMVTALRTNSMNEFKQYYRSVDTLLIDDIQFFANKGRSMEEFFHTFNTLLECQKQIVIAGDRLPLNLDIEPRLRTRMNMGVTLSIDVPDLETRVAILRRKCDEAVGKVELDNKVAFFIAENFKSNIRDLEGALNRVIVSAKLRNQTTITIAFVREILKDQLEYYKQNISIDRIKKTTANYYMIKVMDIDSKKRARLIARPRQIAMALSKKLTGHSLPEVGKHFGGRDHTTVLHACRKIEELRQIDPILKEDWDILIRTLTA